MNARLVHFADSSTPLINGWSVSSIVVLTLTPCTATSYLTINTFFRTLRTTVKELRMDEACFCQCRHEYFR